MSDVAIGIEKLSKQYRIGGKQETYSTLRDTLVQAAKWPLHALRSALARNGANTDPTNTIWALREVSFEVKRGEVVGIIGRNGAGKSTLLKILSRITEPTAGYADIYGRVGSLLEVGTGFHAELTGRENIYLNGAILGMSRAELDRRFDEMVAFAEVEKFIDTPVKHYSSGMYLRLAFGVAAHLQTEILLVDEVLAVGDAAFQKKCLGMMGQVAKEGRTILFVSHNMTALKALCSRAVWLHEGKVMLDGDATTVVNRYLSSVDSSDRRRTWEDRAQAPGNEKVRLKSVCVRPESGGEDEDITVETPLLIEIEFWNLTPNLMLNITLTLYTLEDVCLLATAFDPRSFQAGVVRAVCRIPGNLLNDQAYRLRAQFVRDASVVLFACEQLCTFEVVDVKRKGPWYGKWPGLVRPRLEWQCEWAPGEKSRDFLEVAAQ